MDSIGKYDTRPPHSFDRLAMRHSLDALTTFAHVADCGSFSAAARQMNKSQSSVSEAIANLEIDLGVQLFDRSGRQPRLTAEGAVLLTQARQVMDANAQLERLADAFSRGLETRLTVALSDAYEWTDFEYLVTGISQRYPRLTFECMVAESHDVLTACAAGGHTSACWRRWIATRPISPANPCLTPPSWDCTSHRHTRWRRWIRSRPTTWHRVDSCG